MKYRIKFLTVVAILVMKILGTQGEWFLGMFNQVKQQNYSALIAKAADAGYRVIILLAGITKLFKNTNSATY